LLLAFLFYYWKKIDVAAFTKKINPLYKLSYHKYYMDELYHATVVTGLLKWNDLLAWFDQHIIDAVVNFMAVLMRGFSSFDGLFDKYIVDGLVNGVAAVVGIFGRGLREIQTGKLQNYILGAVLGTVFIIILSMI